MRCELVAAFCRLVIWTSVYRTTAAADDDDDDDDDDASQFNIFTAYPGHILFINVGPSSELVF